MVIRSNENDVSMYVHVVMHRALDKFIISTQFLLSSLSVSPFRTCFHASPSFEAVNYLWLGPSFFQNGLRLSRCETQRTCCLLSLSPSFYYTGISHLCPGPPRFISSRSLIDLVAFYRRRLNVAGWEAKYTPPGSARQHGSYSPRRADV